MFTKESHIMIFNVTYSMKNAKIGFRHTHGKLKPYFDSNENCYGCNHPFNLEVRGHVKHIHL